MFSASTKLWDRPPTFHPSVPERDADLLRGVARAMLTTLYPASSSWKVQYQPHAYVLSCRVPQDATITLANMRDAQRVSPGRIETVWCEWNARQGCLLLCCRLQRNAVASKVSGAKRPRSESGDEALKVAGDKG